MTNTPVILFTFAGRKPNLQLQLPMVRRILRDNPTVEYHVWNFARNDADRAYIKTIRGARITVWNGTDQGFASPVPTLGEGAQFGAGEHNAAYRHYAQPQFHDHLFVKIDDDIVFLETARFASFVAAIDRYRGSAMVANIINNGACTPVQQGIWEEFLTMRIPLLDIHLHGAFAQMAHGYFFKHHREILGQPIELIPTEDWLSINAVGYDWNTLRRVLSVIGTPHPAYLAGRNMRHWGRVFGDEGVFQTLPRIIVKGFTAAHLTYGPQDADANLDAWRKNYRLIGQAYLKANESHCESVELPEKLSVGSAGQRFANGQHVDNRMLSAATARWGPDNWRTRAMSMENDPCVGRYVP